MNGATVLRNNFRLVLPATIKQLLLIILICLCGFKGFSQPANDEPCSAVTLTADVNCNYQTFTNAAATTTAGVPAPGCANYQGGDVWFQVVVPAGGTLIFDSQTGVITDGGMAIYSAASCAGPFTLIECDDDDSPNGAMPRIVRSGLTPGSTVWIRFWEYGGNGNGTFGICVTLPPPPPTNDDPCTAISLSSGNTCSYQNFSNSGATTTSGVPAPGCANYQGGDVWFQTVVPCGGSLRFDTQSGTITDGGMAIYSGSACGGPLTLIECDDDDSGNGLMPQITRNNLTPGSIIWIRVWEYGNDNQGSFGICITEPPPPGPGGSCQTATPFCTSNVYTFPNNTNVPSLGGGGIYGCLFTTPNPFWYYMQVQNPGNITIGISQTSIGGVPLDVDFALWGPFTNLNASCGGLTAANNISCSYSASATETAVINNAQAGEYYILLLTNFANQAGTITFAQSGGTGSSTCNIICSLTATNSGPVCGGSTFNLTASNVPGATYSWTGPNCFTSTAQNPTGVIAPTVPGTYTYTVTATTPAGSQCNTTTTLVVNAQPVLGPDKADTICAQSTLNLTTQFTTTGSTTQWTINGSAVATPSAVNVSGIYQLIATNASGCKDTALFTLRVDTVKAVVTPSNAFCAQNGTITVTNPVGIGAFDYNINTSPGVYQASNVFNVPAAGPYTIITRDAEGCTNTQTVNVSFTNNLTLQSIADTTICLGNSVRLTTTGNGASFSWTPTTGLNDPSSSSPLANPLVSTAYVVTATLGSCTAQETVNVQVVEAVSVNAGTDVSIISGDHVQLNATATGASSYLWTPSTGLSAVNILNPEANPAVTTTYTLTATNDQGCIASDNLVVTVIPYCIGVKNAFTPNGDGINDMWQVYDQYDCLKNITLHVFNRYGGKVFESRDYRNNWDGKYKGQPVPDGTYYAVINFTLFTGKVLTIKSDLTILR